MGHTIYTVKFVFNFLILAFWSSMLANILCALENIIGYNYFKKTTRPPYLIIFLITSACTILLPCYISWWENTVKYILLYLHSILLLSVFALPILRFLYYLHTHTDYHVFLMNWLLPLYSIQFYLKKYSLILYITIPQWKIWLNLKMSQQQLCTLSWRLFHLILVEHSKPLKLPVISLILCIPGFHILRYRGPAMLCHLI